MGYELSLISVMGIVALSGIVVNDSLILVVAINDFVRNHRPIEEAVVAGAVQRFRPVLLTSLTTFFGLSPMILESSVQARFLIPMAVSLGFGVLFATFITLIFVPASCLAVSDVQTLVRRGYSLVRRSQAEAQAPMEPVA
jgi:multidrug efflux pump subunit AcrB